MKTPYGLITFDLPIPGSTIKTSLVTTPEKAKAMLAIAQEINSERRVLRRAFKRLSRVQQKVVLKHLNIKTAGEEFLQKIIPIINSDGVNSNENAP